MNLQITLYCLDILAMLIILIQEQNMSICVCFHFRLLEIYLLLFKKQTWYILKITTKKEGLKD